MKKLVSLMLCLMLALSCANALAFNYQQRFDNEATFETLEEARINAVDYLTDAMGKAYVADPALDTYPQGTTYIMRSSGIYSAASAGPRMNTTILVYTEESFETKEDAKAYLVNLGLDKIIEEAVGSVVLVTPASPVTEGSSGITGGFGQADQYAFFQLQQAMTNINGNVTGGAAADNNYYGGLTYRSIIGIDVHQQLHRLHLRLCHPHRRHAADWRRHGAHPGRGLLRAGVPGEPQRHRRGKVQGRQRCERLGL